MRSVRISPNEYYHIFNRGVGKQVIYLDDSDYYRFLFLILYFQSPITFPHVGRSVEEFVKHRVLDKVDQIVEERQVELTSFCLMPNHFHLLVKEQVEGGISTYMHRILNGYGKYFNTKYRKSGHVFEGPYRAVHVESNEQLLHLSAYIHRNPRELTTWHNMEESYPWSSYSDLTKENRWGNLLESDILLGQFDNSAGYADFVKSSTTKLHDWELSDL